MKRLDLVQLIIIIVGIFSGFYLMGLIPKFLFYLFSWLSNGLRGGYLLGEFIENILLVSFYSLVSIYAIKNSKHIAEWVCNKANLTADINFALDTGELLFTLFIGLGIYGLIKNLSSFLLMSHSYIKSKNSFEGAYEIFNNMGYDIVTYFISLLLFFTFLYYAKVFADFAASKINNIEQADAIAEKTA
jgi:hypothetical protein